MIDKTELIYANMTARQRQAFKLHQSGNYTQKQIGEIMGIAQKNVSILIKRAKNRVKKRLNRV